MSPQSWIHRQLLSSLGTDKVYILLPFPRPLSLITHVTHPLTERWNVMQRQSPTGILKGSSHAMVYVYRWLILSLCWTLDRMSSRGMVRKLGEMPIGLFLIDWMITCFLKWIFQLNGYVKRDKQYNISISAEQNCLHWQSHPSPIDDRWVLMYGSHATTYLRVSAAHVSRCLIPLLCQLISGCIQTYIRVWTQGRVSCHIIILLFQLTDSQLQGSKE